MNTRRVRMQLPMVIIARPGIGSEAPNPRVGTVVQYEDGRWRLDVAGVPPLHGDRFEGSREATATLLRVMLAPAALAPPASEFAPITPPPPRPQMPASTDAPATGTPAP